MSTRQVWAEFPRADHTPIIYNIFNAVTGIIQIQFGGDERESGGVCYLCGGRGLQSLQVRHRNQIITKLFKNTQLIELRDTAMAGTHQFTRLVGGCVLYLSYDLM